GSRRLTEGNTSNGTILLSVGAFQPGRLPFRRTRIRASPKTCSCQTSRDGTVGRSQRHAPVHRKMTKSPRRHDPLGGGTPPAISAFRSKRGDTYESTANR